MRNRGTKNWQYIMLHHSKTKDGIVVDTPSIRHFHMSYRIDDNIVTKKEFNRRKEIGDGERFVEPWRDIGYHFTVERVGNDYKIYDGRSLTLPGAHCTQKGMNTKAIGICCIGDYDTAKPDDKMLDLLTTELVIPLMKDYNIPVENIVGHRDYASYKSCPGDKFDLDDYRNRVREYLTK